MPANRNELARSPEGSPKPFAITAHPLGPDRLRVEVQGELDLVHAEDLKLALQTPLRAGTDVLLDISAVEFIDSTGLSAIVEGVNTARESRADFQISATMQPQPHRLMELTGMLVILPLTEDSASTDGDASTHVRP